MTTEYESTHYAWSYDHLYGVGYFTRKSDNATTYLETGGDCQDLRRSLRRLAQKTGSRRYPAAAPKFDAVFDAIADQYEYGLAAKL